jgi:hypothetical protein
VQSFKIFQSFLTVFNGSDFEGGPRGSMSKGKAQISGQGVEIGMFRGGDFILKGIVKC